LVSAKPRVYSQRWMYGSAVGYAAIITSTHSAFLVSPTFQMLNFIEPPWWGPVCPVVWEGRSREAPLSRSLAESRLTAAVNCGPLNDRNVV
jgi:hypothetical protein